MLFKLLYLPTSLDVANRSHFSDYEVAEHYKKNAAKLSRNMFLSRLRRRLAKNHRNAIRSHIDTILP